VGGATLDNDARALIRCPAMDDTGWTRWAYVAACVIVPAAWGALTAWLFSRGDRRAAAAGAPRPPQPPSHIDYTI
jgi:hypothetical protein